MNEILSNEVYKQVLADSFGGIMYDVSNRDKYDTKELLKLWDKVPPTDKEASGGITKGVFEFLTGN